MTITINGEEYVSDAARAADQGLSKFASNVPTYAKVIAGLTVAYQAVMAAIGRVRDLVVQSFDAYDALATSQRKLEGTSRLTGLSMDYLQSIVEKGRKEFGLSQIQANDYASEVAKLAVASGNAGRATDLLTGFLNVGAARGLSASESLQAASQAIVGIDEGTDRLFGKNPSALWKDYESVIGKSAGKFTDMDKQAALAFAVLNGGNKVVGAYGEFLGSAQGKQAQFNTNMEETKARAGEAMQPLREFAIDLMLSLTKNTTGGFSALASLTLALVDFLRAVTPIAQPLLTFGTILIEVLSVGAQRAMIGIRRLSGATAVSVGQMISAFGSLVEKGGDILKVFGVNVVQSAGQAMREYGEEMVQVNQNKLLRVEYDYLNLEKRASEIVDRWTKKNVEKVKDSAEGMAKAVEDGTPRVANAAGAMGKQVEEKLGPPLKIALGMTQGALERLSEAANSQLSPVRAKEFNKAMDSIRENADALRLDSLPPIRQETETAAGNAKDMAREVEMLARGAVDAATSFGVIDDKAARSLNSAISIASAVGNLAKSGFSFAGVSGVIGGVASIVSAMMASDAERRRLLRENSIQLQKLREEGVTLSTRVSGEKVSKVTQALSGADLRQGSYFADKERSVLGQLAEFGLTIRDLEAVAAEYGIQGITKNGRLNDFNALRQLIEALSIGGGKVRVGQSFSEQLQFFRDSQRVDGVEGVGGLQGLIDFLRNVGGVRALDGIDVMSDPQDAARRLRGIFTQLSNGGIDSAAIGRLTGSQFSDILMEIIGGLSSAASSRAGDSSGSTESSGAAGGTSGSSAGGTAVPQETIQSVIRAMDNRILNVLSSHTPLFDRIAVATEGSWAELKTLNGKVDELIVVTAGQIEATDARLEAMRRMAALERGSRPSFG
ncbi:MAG: hypothetical protein ACK5N1_01235 [Gemmatimonas sp.]|uniref:hypothetical protein n=1 Tax=Gemmatimonas sp. TaxID=1962908 RepID=UPI0022C2D9ED|nr:hypothetical protein [Gemmatimonas sp.]